MKTYKFTMLIALFIGVLTACSVEEDEPIGTNADGDQVTGVDDGNISATDSANFRMILTDSTSKRWTTSIFTLAGSSNFTNCRLDDIMTFFVDGTYSYDGGQLCGAEDNQAMRNGTWELDYTNKKVYFDRGSSESHEAEVIGLKDNELRLKGSYMAMEVRGLFISN